MRAGNNDLILFCVDRIVENLNVAVIDKCARSSRNVSDCDIAYCDIHVI